MAIDEYMAAAKNVVATKIDAIPALVDDSVDGLLVEDYNLQDADDKVLWLYHHPNEAAEMRRKVLKKVIENYNINHVLNQYIDMFEKLIFFGQVLEYLLYLRFPKLPIVFIGNAAVSEERRVVA